MLNGPRDTGEGISECSVEIEEEVQLKKDDTRQLVRLAFELFELLEPFELLELLELLEPFELLELSLTTSYSRPTPPAFG